MNKFRVVLELETYSADPEDWLIDSITDQLESDETLRGCRVERVSKFTTEN